QARLGAGVAKVGTENQIAGSRLMRWQSIAIDGGSEMLAPSLRLADAPEDGIDLNAFDRLVGNVLQLHRDAGDELVLALLDPRVVPAGVHVSDFENFLDVELMTAACEDQDCGYCKNNAPHNAIVMRSELLHLDVRARLLERHSARSKRRQVRPLYAEDDTADIRGIPGNESIGPNIVARRDC